MLSKFITGKTEMYADINKPNVYFGFTKLLSGGNEESEKIY